MGYRRSWLFLIFSLVILPATLFSSASAAPLPPAKIVTGFVSNAVSALVKWLWSLKSTSSNKPVQQHGRSMVKFEGGYTVETIFDGTKLGVEPYSVEVSPNGEFLVLDSENSNLYKIPVPISRYGRPKVLAGSSEGYIGHIDGRLRDARMNHPKGLTVDDSGNIYVADTMNMAIRKITDQGVTTIAGGGKWGQSRGHVDGASEDAKFSNDFDVKYVGSSCSLLVVDRGNQAIREIQLHHDDCNTDSSSSDDYDASFHLGIVVLLAAGFFGYMLALLQWRVRAMFSSHDDPRPPLRKGTAPPPHQRLPPNSVRPPLIPSEDDDEFEKQEGFFVSIGRLFLNSGTSMAEILGGLFSSSSSSSKRNKSSQLRQYHHHPQYQQQYRTHHQSWPVQESYVIPNEDEPPPPLETRTPTHNRKTTTYPFVTNNNNEIEKPQNSKPIRPNTNYLDKWDDDNNGGDYDEGDPQHQHQQQQPPHHQYKHPKLQHHQIQQHQQHHQIQTRYSSSTTTANTPQGYYEPNREPNEIVFGAVQEHDGRREAMVIKAVDYGDPKYSHHSIRPRLNYVGYSHAY
ncbi:hypothetical protein HN51_070391 [Arachis hypogaea]|uniref:NHL repeat-containing protein n=2 Tax=Arachis TaxID=3817 RepID=A0A444Z282_ARAHY|nr:uncharacterized protein LOC107644000 isoform X1 [Arachis ipaensis]XP_025655394.1 uncharacterized protein LOC112750767 isoform X1 [Arachis hypogaea]QHO12778.1 uncharacterized protein DS421_15g509820 [Arachis hypogaea]RYR08297.1 hypothetical protein Ahy_B05g075903 isoform B [Arachis hypogaea]